MQTFLVQSERYSLFEIKQWDKSLAQYNMRLNGVNQNLKHAGVKMILLTNWSPEIHFWKWLGSVGYCFWVTALLSSVVLYVVIRSTVLINTIKISYHMCFYHIKFRKIDFRDLGGTNQAAAPNQLEADEYSILIRFDTLTEVSYVYSGKPQPSICFKILTYLLTCLFWENGENIDIHTLE